MQPNNIICFDLNNADQLIAISEFIAEYKKADQAKYILWRMLSAAMVGEFAKADNDDCAAVLRFYTLTDNLIALVFRIFGDIQQG